MRSAFGYRSRQQRSRREVGADLVVPVGGEAGLRVVVEAPIGPAPGDDRLAEVVEERREPDGEGEAVVGGRLDDGERVLVDGEVVVAALLVEPDRRAELGQQLDEDARVAREPQSARAGSAPSRSFESSPIPSAERPPPMRSPETSFTAGASSRIWPSSSSSGVEAELRDEAEGADQAQRVLAEALRRDGAEAASLEVGAAAERVDELARVEPPGHRVDGEVAPAHVVLDRELRVGDDLEVVPARPGRDLLARRRELDPGRRQLADPAVARVQPDADEPVGDDEILHAAVRRERRAQSLGVEAGHEEVGILRVQPEQLVAHGAADDVGVEVEALDVFLDLVAHRAILAALESSP